MLLPKQIPRFGAEAINDVATGKTFVGS